MANVRTLTINGVTYNLQDTVSGYLTSYTETDPTVPSWAKQTNKPSYALTEITGADDVKAIEALTGTSGLLKKTAANTWALDTNTYLTSFTETDPVFSASAAAGITSNDITNWNSKTSNTGTITEVKTVAGTHTTIDVTSGKAEFNVPTKTSHLTNDSNFLDTNSTLNAAKLSGAIPSAVTATTQSTSDDSTKLATTAFVHDMVDGLPTPMQFIGTVGTSGTTTWANLPAASGHTGYTYKVITDHTAETGKPAAKVGDTIISNGTDWIVIPSGDEPSGTVTSVTLIAGGGISLDTDNTAITSSGSRTISHADTSSQASITASSRTYIKSVTLDTYGHVTGLTTGTESVTDTNTTYSLSNALSSHKFTETLTAGGSGSGTSTATMEFVAGTGISLTDDTTNKKITIASTVTVPTNVSDFTNDAGYLTSYTETDPVFSASAAANITSTDISNWNAKISDDKTWNGVSLTKSYSNSNSTIYIPYTTTSSNPTGAQLNQASTTPGVYVIAMYDGSKYLISTTPSSNDSSTKVATTAYVQSVLPSVPSRGTPASGGTTLSIVNTGDMYTWNNKSQVQIVRW